MSEGVREGYEWPVIKELPVVARRDGLLVASHGKWTGCEVLQYKYEWQWAALDDAAPNAYGTGTIIGVHSSSYAPERAGRYRVRVIAYGRRGMSDATSLSYVVWPDEVAA
jgi:hypothetical protein